MSESAILSPVKVQKRLNAASGFLDLRMPDEAIGELEVLLADDVLSQLRPVKRFHGEALIELERFEQAREIYVDLLQSEPEDIDAAIKKGWCEKRMGRLPAAIRTMERAVRLHPREPILQYNLACYHALATDKARCLSRLGVAIRLDRNIAAMVADESDFDNLRQDADFNSLVRMASSV